MDKRGEVSFSGASNVPGPSSQFLNPPGDKGGNGRYPNGPSFTSAAPVGLSLTNQRSENGAFNEATPPSGSALGFDFWGRGAPRHPIGRPPPPTQPHVQSQTAPKPPSTFGLDKLRNNLPKPPQGRNCTSCEPPNQIPAYSYCNTCSDFLCQKCDEAHRMVKLTRGTGSQNLKNVRRNFNVFTKTRCMLTGNKN